METTAGGLSKGRANNGRAHVLVVESEEALRDLFAYLFREQDFEVLLAKDAQEGLALFLQTQPDVVIINEALNQLSRYELIRSIRSAKEDSDVPIIAVIKGRRPTGKVLAAGANVVARIPQELEVVPTLARQLLHLEH